MVTPGSRKSASHHQAFWVSFSKYQHFFCSILLICEACTEGPASLNMGGKWKAAAHCQENHPNRSAQLLISSRFCCLAKQFSPRWRVLLVLSATTAPSIAPRFPGATSYSTGARRSVELHRLCCQKPTDSSPCLDTSCFTQVPISSQCHGCGHCYDRHLVLSLMKTTETTETCLSGQCQRSSYALDVCFITKTQFHPLATLSVCSCVIFTFFWI